MRQARIADSSCPVTSVDAASRFADSVTAFAALYIFFGRGFSASRAFNYLPKLMRSPRMPCVASPRVCLLQPWLRGQAEATFHNGHEPRMPTARGTGRPFLGVPQEIVERSTADEEALGKSLRSFLV